MAKIQLFNFSFMVKLTPSPDTHLCKIVINQVAVDFHSHFCIKQKFEYERTDRVQGINWQLRYLLGSGNKLLLLSSGDKQSNIIHIATISHYLCGCCKFCCRVSTVLKFPVNLELSSNIANLFRMLNTFKYFVHNSIIRGIKLLQSLGNKPDGEKQTSM